MTTTSTPMKEMCADCPFGNSKAQRHMRNSLRPGRLQGIDTAVSKNIARIECASAVEQAIQLAVETTRQLADKNSLRNFGSDAALFQCVAARMFQQLEAERTKG